jgi:hypothetical protein
MASQDGLSSMELVTYLVHRIYISDPSRDFISCNFRISFCTLVFSRIIHFNLFNFLFNLRTKTTTTGKLLLPVVPFTPAPFFFISVITSDSRSFS